MVVMGQKSNMLRAEDLYLQREMSMPGVLSLSWTHKCTLFLSCSPHFINKQKCFVNMIVMIE